MDHVTARFGGRERVFRFPRQPGGNLHHPVFTDEFSAYGAFQRFGTGIWSIADLIKVLSPRLPGSIVYQPDSEIVDVIQAGGPGTYAPLAARVLEAALFGLDPGNAAWDERDPFATPA